MRRANVLKIKVAESQHNLDAAIKARDVALAAVSQAPSDSKANTTLDQAIEVVPALQQKLEALEEALKQAEAHDRADDIAAVTDRCLKAREKALQASVARVTQARKLQSAIDALAVALREFDDANDATLLALYDATQGLAPTDRRDAPMFGQRKYLASNMVRAPLSGAFALALHDAGVGEVAFKLDEHLEFKNANNLAHGDRSGLVSAVGQSTNEIESALHRIYQLAGLVPSDLAPEPTLPKFHKDDPLRPADEVGVDWGLLPSYQIAGTAPKSALAQEQVND